MPPLKHPENIIPKYVILGYPEMTEKKTGKKTVKKTLTKTVKVGGQTVPPPRRKPGGGPRKRPLPPPPDHAICSTSLHASVRSPTPVS